MSLGFIMELKEMENPCLSTGSLVFKVIQSTSSETDSVRLHENKRHGLDIIPVLRSSWPSGRDIQGYNLLI